MPQLGPSVLREPGRRAALEVHDDVGGGGWSPQVLIMIIGISESPNIRPKILEHNLCEPKPDNRIEIENFDAFNRIDMVPNLDISI